MPNYEYTYIARQDIQPQQVEAITAEFTKIFESNDATVVSTEYWGLKPLAYRIKKYKKGHYVMFRITGSSAALAEVERNARIHEDVVRYMTIRVEEHEEGESIMMRANSYEKKSYDKKPYGDDKPKYEKKEG
jgi:small subunit ribosomal protein S6